MSKRFYVQVTQEDIDRTIREARKHAKRFGCGNPDNCPIDYAVARMLPGGDPSKVQSSPDELTWHRGEWNSAQSVVLGTPSRAAVRFMKRIDATTGAIMEKEAKIPKPPKPCRLPFFVAA